MYDIDENYSFYIEDFKTLHHDIGLVHRTNGLWDLWFGQDEISKYYKDLPRLDIIEGDIVSATEVHSLQVGIIVACLTSWNYLNRTGNPLYTEFGNKSYSLLKQNVGTNTQYKIKHYFMECLNRMRRVYSVENLDVFQVEDNPYVYKVVFKVISVTNTVVDGEFYLDTDSSKNTSMIDISYNHPYTSASNPLEIKCVLKDEYGSFIEDELLYVYIKKNTDSKFKFYGVTLPTEYDGSVSITIPPKGLSLTTQIMFVFKGNSLYNPSYSKIINIESVAYYIKSKYTYKTVTNSDNESVDVLDKQILYVEDSLGNSLDKFRLGELLSDYTNLSNINLTDRISLTDIVNNSVNGNVLEYDVHEAHKLYLVPTNRIISGTNKRYYDGYVWNSDGTGLILVYSDTKNTGGVQLNSNRPHEVHFLIDNGDNGLYEIDFGDGHLYYKIDMYENEI